MISEKLREEILAHAEREYPRECCGLVVIVKGRKRYHPCANIAPAGDFAIDPRDWTAAEDAGSIVAVVHSHCNLPPIESQSDLVGCEKSGLPWLIVSWPTAQFNFIRPSGYVAGLIGREFSHGVLDCYSLVRDYYAQELGIEIPDFQRDDEWWKKGGNLYLDNFESAGFVRVDPETLRLHDGILMQVGSPVPNHAAVYLGDNLVLHHVTGRLSCKDVYGGMWHKNTVAVVRHRSLL